MKVQTVSMRPDQFYELLASLLGRSPRSIRRSIGQLIKSGMIKKLVVNGTIAFEFSNEWLEKAERDIIETYGELPPLGADYDAWLAERDGGHGKSK